MSIDLARLVTLTALVAVAACAHDARDDARPARVAQFGRAASSPAASSTPASTDRPPPTRRAETTDVIHGVSVPDPYRWLEDARGADVTRWLDGQDAYARRHLDALADHRFFVERIKALMSVGDVEVTVARGGRQFFRRRGAGEDKAQLFVRDLHGSERVLVDAAAWPPDDHIAFQNYWPSHDGRFVAIQISKNNSDDSSIEVRDVETGKVIEVIQGHDTIRFTGAAMVEEFTIRGILRAPRPLSRGVRCAITSSGAGRRERSSSRPRRGSPPCTDT